LVTERGVTVEVSGHIEEVGLV